MSSVELTDAQRQQLAEHIGRCLVQLESEIKHLKLITQPVSPDVSIGRLSRLESLNELAVNEKALASAQLRQQRLQAVRPLLQQPDYGFCSRCDEAIPFARLLSIPESRLCVACKERSGG